MRVILSPDWHINDAVNRTTTILAWIEKPWCVDTTRLISRGILFRLKSSG